MCVTVYVRERVSEGVCMLEKGKESVSVCVCVCMLEKGRVCVCVC